MWMCSDFSDSGRRRLSNPPKIASSMTLWRSLIDLVNTLTIFPMISMTDSWMSSTMLTTLLSGDAIKSLSAFSMKLSTSSAMVSRFSTVSATD